MSLKYLGLGKNLDVYDSFNYARGQDKSSQKKECYKWEKGVGMQRSCQIFYKLFMHTTLILMLEKYMFKELNDLKWNHIYLHVIQKGFRKKELVPILKKKLILVEHESFHK